MVSRIELAFWRSVVLIAADMPFAASKVATALKLSEDDDATIDSLKKQIEKAWALVESHNEREIRANETIQRLKLEISNLTRILEKQSGIAGKDNTVDELLKVCTGAV